MRTNKKDQPVLWYYLPRVHGMKKKKGSDMLVTRTSKKENDWECRLCCYCCSLFFFFLMTKEVSFKSDTN